jgi:hypothetical protein
VQCSAPVGGHLGRRPHIVPRALRPVAGRVARLRSTAAAIISTIAACCYLSVICCIAERNGPQCSAARSTSHRSTSPIGSARPCMRTLNRPLRRALHSTRCGSCGLPRPSVLSVAERSQLAVDRPTVAAALRYSDSIGGTGRYGPVRPAHGTQCDGLYFAATMGQSRSRLSLRSLGTA